MSKHSTLYTFEIEKFKKSWPCHGFPDNFNRLEVVFANNLDVIDYVAWDLENHKEIDPINFQDHYALSCLIDDAKKKLIANPIVL